MRNGKIARLPRMVREQLNRKLDAGQQGEVLLSWLNGLDAVKEMLDEEFCGDPITKQNLSAWRQGGYAEWLRNQEARLWVQQRGDLGRQRSEDDGWPREEGFNEQLARVASVELAMRMRELVEGKGGGVKRGKGDGNAMGRGELDDVEQQGASCVEFGGTPNSTGRRPVPPVEKGTTDCATEEEDERAKAVEKRWKALRQVLRELSRLRRDEHRAVRMQIAQQKWERHLAREDRLDEEKEDEWYRKQELARVMGRMSVEEMAKPFGGSEEAKRMAAYMIELEEGLKPGSLVKLYRKEPVGGGRQTSKSHPPSQGSRLHEISARRDGATIQPSSKEASKIKENIQQPTSNIEHPMKDEGRAAGKAPEPAGRNACATKETHECGRGESRSVKVELSNEERRGAE
jgi:hypothetical protein